MKFVFFLLSGLLMAQSSLRVEKARFRPFEIAISGQAELASVVLNDLELSGVFRSAMPAIAEGTVKIQSSAKETTALVNNKQLFKYKQPASRQLGHQIAGDVYKFFTGEKSFFGSQIAASKMTPQGKQIVLMDFDGNGERQVTKASSINILPTITPTGKEIYFTSFINRNSDLFSIKTDGSGLKTISNHKGLNTGTAFAPNGAKMLITLSLEGKSDIYQTDLHGQNKIRITSGYGLNTSPSYSPDGSKVAFVSNRSGNPQVYIMNANGTGAERITMQGKYNQAPKWSSTGDYIVFTARDEFNVFDIFLVEVKTKKITRVTQDQGSNEEADFAPNGRMLVFSSTRSGTRDLFVSNLDGSVQKQITHGGRYWTPSWGPAL
ncbi:MAG: translocation protein TolB [Myxococcota bacterium]